MTHTHFESQLETHENLARAYFSPFAAAVKLGKNDLVAFYHLRFRYHRRLRDLYRSLIG